MKLFGAINGMQFTASRESENEPWEINQTQGQPLPEGLAQRLVEGAWRYIKLRDMPSA